MSRHSENIQHLWHATSVLDAWFHRLGGAACYRAFHDSDSALYIASTLVKRLGIEMPGEILEQDALFQNAAAPVLPTVNDHIAQIVASPAESAVLLCSFVTHANDEITRCTSRPHLKWEQLVGEVRRMSAAVEAEGLTRNVPETRKVRAAESSSAAS